MIQAKEWSRLLLFQHQKRRHFKEGTMFDISFSIQGGLMVSKSCEFYLQFYMLFLLDCTLVDVQDVRVLGSVFVFILRGNLRNWRIQPNQRSRDAISQMSFCS